MKDKSKALDLKDKKILHALSGNARLSASKIASKVGLKKETAVYRINRLFKERIIKRVITLINTESLGFTRYELYLQLKSISQEKENEILKFIEENDMFLWVVSGLGEYDILTEFYARDIAEFEKIINEIKNAYGEYIKNLAFSFVLNEYSFPLKLTGYYTEEPILIKQEKVDIDNQDCMILNEIANDARKPIVEIAEKLNLSPDSVIYRIRNLQKKKIILGYRAVINEKVLNLQKYKLILKLRSSNEETQNKILSFLKSHKATQYIKKCIGGWDFSITLLANDVQEFRNIIVELKNNLKEELESYTALILFEEHKNTYFPKGILGKF